MKEKKNMKNKKFLYTIETKYPSHWSDMFMKVNATMRIRNLFPELDKKPKLMAFDKIEKNRQFFTYEVYVAPEELDGLRKTVDAVKENYKNHLITTTIPFTHKEKGYCECQHWIELNARREYVLLFAK